MLCNVDSLRQYRSRLDKRLLGSSAGLTDRFSSKVIGLSALAIMLPSVALNTVIEELERKFVRRVPNPVWRDKARPRYEGHPRFRTRRYRKLC